MSPRLPTRAALGLCLALLASAAVAPPASAASYVPGFVMGPTVPAHVSGILVGDSVTLSMAGLSVSRVATTTTVTLALAGVPAGLHEYTLSVLSAGVTTSTSGFVLVETRMEDVYGSVLGHRQDDSAVTAVGNVSKEIEALEAQVRASDNATRAALEARIAQLHAQGNATQAGLAAIPGQVAGNLTDGVTVTVDDRADTQMLARMDELHQGQTAAHEAATAAQQAGTYGLYGLALLALVVVLLVWLLLRNARKGRRETLVMLMLLATKAGITPDSPEFQLALDAFDGKKPKKVKGKKGQKAIEAKAS